VNHPESPPTRRLREPRCSPIKSARARRWADPRLTETEYEQLLYAVKRPDTPTTKNIKCRLKRGKSKRDFLPILTTPLATAYPPKRASRDRYLTLLRWTRSRRRCSHQMMNSLDAVKRSCAATPSQRVDLVTGVPPAP
jgi:hypothetical protein